MYFLCLHLVSLLQGTRNLMIMNDYDHGNSSFLILYDSELMVQILTPGASRNHFDWGVNSIFIKLPEFYWMC